MREKKKIVENGPMLRTFFFIAIAAIAGNNGGWKTPNQCIEAQVPASRHKFKPQGLNTYMIKFKPTA